MFVKKIYHEEHNKNEDYSFKQALKDASKRKHEMGNMGKSKKRGRTTNKKNYGKRTRRRVR